MASNSNSTELTMQNNILSPKLGEQIKIVLPNHMDTDRFQRIVLSEFKRNAKLFLCSRDSVFNCMYKCAELGLVPGNSLGEAFFIPYKNECTLIVGYKGFLKLIRQSDQIGPVITRCVYDNDEFDLSYGNTDSIRLVPARLLKKEPGEFFAVYAIAHFKSGEQQIEVMFKDQIKKIQLNSYGSEKPDSPWQKHFDEMARKTVLRRIAKYLPLSPQVFDAIHFDEQADRGKQEISVSLAESGLLEPKKDAVQNLIESLEEDQNK